QPATFTVSLDHPRRQHRAPHRAPPPLPTRRSSDLAMSTRATATATCSSAEEHHSRSPIPTLSGSTCPSSALSRVRKLPSRRLPKDRKSTRLNSSHVKISYAVFCLKEKKVQHISPCT